jgi:hypothetical protein
MSASEDFRAGPTYHELLKEYMKAAGVEHVEELWARMPLVLDREAFELMYEGTWPYLNGLFFAAIQDALSLEDVKSASWAAPLSFTIWRSRTS